MAKNIKAARTAVKQAMAELEKVNDQNKSGHESAAYLAANKKVDDAVKQLPPGMRANWQF